MMNNESVADDRTPAASAPGPQIEIASDEDWKNRVKAEDAALDQQFRTESTSGESAGKDQTAGRRSNQASGSATTEARPQPEAAREMPNPTFADLVVMLSTQAMMFLGLIPNPSTKKAEIQLATARYFIDMMGILEEKTAGQLTKEESQILDDTLHSLRMTYMERSRQTV
ncbi:MAG TPA: DUF1844 domain-containing protein [Planctomycetaceae bacterium]|nr:DUF1844 domain-containing protein [Planctomycetaceae bacterium]